MKDIRRNYLFAPFVCPLRSQSRPRALSLANASRQIRKIRCDGRPEGCSPCAQNRTLCKTTDRITGRATTRGHTEATEAENNYLRAQIAELQAQLKELGVEPRTVSGYSEFSPTSLPWQQQPVGLASSTPGWEDASQRRTSDSSLPGYTPATGLDDSDYRPLPQFKHGSVGDNYLGVSSGDTLLSNIKGTSLSVFGTEIDITDFVQSGSDYDKSVVSYTHFLKVILNEDADVQYVTFGDYQRLHEYATWYLRSMNPYTMLLDRPTVMNLVCTSSHTLHIKLTRIRSGGLATSQHFPHHQQRLFAST